MWKILSSTSALAISAVLTITTTSSVRADVFGGGPPDSGYYADNSLHMYCMDFNYFPSTREYAMQYGVDKQLLDSLSKEIVIMHPGPINRGVEITSDVADSKQSVILDQVENGVAIRMAVIYLLASKIKP